MPNSGRIDALLGGRTEGSRELWGERRISGVYGTETPNSGRIGALPGVVEEGAP